MAKKKINATVEAIQELPIVKYLEDRAKCGFRTVVKNDQDYAEPLFRSI